MIKKFYNITPIPEIDSSLLFSLDNPKELLEHEEKEINVINLWKDIISDNQFNSLQFTTDSKYPQTIMLHRSTRQNGWQLSFIDFDGIPSRDEQYDENFHLYGHTDDFHTLFRTLMHYSWHNKKICVEARYAA